MPADASHPPAGAAAPADETRTYLVGGGTGDPFDRHVFASVLALAASEPGCDLLAATGLAADDLVRLFRMYFPHASTWLTAQLALSAATMAPVDGAIEEPDLIHLLLDHRSADAGLAAEWLAVILARRSLGANHLWQDLGLAHRGELSRLMQRHFRPLAEANDRDMKWKKFFYRLLCQRDGVLICKAPNCAVCTDQAHCFGAEAGDPLIRLARSLA